LLHAKNKEALLTYRKLSYSILLHSDLPRDIAS